MKLKTLASILSRLSRCDSPVPSMSPQQRRIKPNAAVTSAADYARIATASFGRSSSPLPGHTGSLRLQLQCPRQRGSQQPEHCSPLPRNRQQTLRVERQPGRVSTTRETRRLCALRRRLHRIPQVTPSRSLSSGSSWPLCPPSRLARRPSAFEWHQAGQPSARCPCGG